MRQFVRRMQRFVKGMPLRTVTFCESCGEACTSACRYEARLERQRQAAHWNSMLPR